MLYSAKPFSSPSSRDQLSFEYYAIGLPFDELNIWGNVAVFRYPQPLNENRFQGSPYIQLPRGPLLNIMGFDEDAGLILNETKYPVHVELFNGREIFTDELVELRERLGEKMVSATHISPPSWAWASRFTKKS